MDFIGELRSEQDKALKELVKYDNGILHAATAFGKTVVSSAIIAQKESEYIDYTGVFCADRAVERGIGKILKY